MSSGEIIDSFGTGVALDSRQHDVIVHENSMDANRFRLPNGLRLVPVESVAAVIEVKLTFTKTEFKKSEAAANQTRDLRLAIDTVAQIAGVAGPVNRRLTRGPERGVPMMDRSLAGRTTFLLFAFKGPRKERIATWMNDGSTIHRVCCLGSGFLVRSEQPEGRPGWSHIWNADEALAAFAEQVYSSVIKHKRSRDATQAHYERYNLAPGLSYWDETGGYEFPNWYKPTSEEVEILGALRMAPKSKAHAKKITRK